MKAVVLKEAGPAENLHVQEIETPRATSGHVVLKVHACAVGYRDIIDRRGGQGFINTPIVLGHEFAGEVVEVGENVRRWCIGDRVVNLYHNFCGICDHCIGGDERRCVNIREIFGLTVNGGYAEYVLADERALERIPDVIPFDIASTLMSAAGVGFHNTANIAGVTIGEDVLVTGATGGVGSMAVQTAKLLGATVWAVTSTKKKVKLLKELGADHVIVDTDGRFHKQILDERDGTGLDVAIDCVGAPTFNSSIRSLHPRGRIVLIGNVDGKRVEVNLGFIIVNTIRIFGSDNVTRAALRQTMELVSTGKLKPMIFDRKPLESAKEAHEILEAKGAFGRIVLTP
jgi:acryloyl-coenzyme A reductase